MQTSFIQSKDGTRLRIGKSGDGSRHILLVHGLAEHMEGLKTNLKGVAMALQGPDAETALRHLAEMQRIVLLAKLESPPNLDEQPESERHAHRQEFRKSLVRVLQELAGMELEILDGDYEAAFARVTGPLYTLRESSHDKFQRAE